MQDAKKLYVLEAERYNLTLVSIMRSIRELTSLYQGSFYRAAKAPVKALLHIQDAIDIWHNPSGIDRMAAKV
jgi:hypothetical protein